MILMATLINRWFFFNEVDKTKLYPVTVENGMNQENDEMKTSHGTQHNNWEYIFVMFNNISVIIFAFMYIVGTIAILA